MLLGNRRDSLEERMVEDKQLEASLAEVQHTLFVDIQVGNYRSKVVGKRELFGCNQRGTKRVGRE